MVLQLKKEVALTIIMKILESNSMLSLSIPYCPIIEHNHENVTTKLTQYQTAALA